jgi:predicted RNA binding protein YcfA (HicA-like mRNA interferase family)
MSEEKLIQKFLTDQKHITEDDCIRLLNNYGYVLFKNSGSHRSFHKRGSFSVTIVVPKGSRYIKSPYVKMIVKVMKLEG